ncbi:MAG: hypothetical protein HGA38_03135 [Candidatus Moranbacteria bacterium]|nr:hypothetical protein [Candidatus Moranbacteria bacterium]
MKKNLVTQRKHGAFEFLRSNVAPVPSCDLCILASECEYYRKGQKQCRAVLDLQEEMYEELFVLEQVRPIDRYLVDRFVKNFCFLAVVDRWIANVGPFRVGDDGLDMQPILSTKTKYERLVLKQAEALGIGPQARARLNLTSAQGFCLADALQRVRSSESVAIEDEAYEEEGEFEDDDGGETEDV